MRDQFSHSEDEEWCYSDSESDDTDEEVVCDDEEDGGMTLGNVVADRHAFQPAPAPGPGPQADGCPLVQLPTFQFAGKGRQQLGSRPLLLFDINGVLMQHNWNGSTHQHDLRPGTHHLLRLLSHFRLGIYSSATRPTITKALTKLQGNLANYIWERRRAAAARAKQAAVADQQQGQQGQRGLLQAPGGGGKKKKKGKLAASGEDGYPAALPPVLFEVVLARDHCVPASQESIAARGGRPWDTVKPLRKYLSGSLRQVVLVDDSAHKAADGEGSNMLVVPCWHGCHHPLGRSDGVLPLLVDLLLQHAAATPAADAPAVAAGGAALASAEAGGQEAAAPLDLRHLTAIIGSKLAQAAAQQLEQAQANGLLSGEEALAAAATLQAAVSGTTAVAAAAAALAAAGDVEEMEVDDCHSHQQHGQEQQQLKRRREAEAVSGVQAGDLSHLSKKKRRAFVEKQRKLAVASMALAAAQLSGGEEAAGGNGASVKDVNSILNQTWGHLSLLVCNKSAKEALAAACSASPPLLQLSEGNAAGSLKRYSITAAGKAAVPTKQYIAELDAYCEQFPTRTAYLAHLDACRRQQQQLELQQGAAEAAQQGGGFFWEQAAAPAAAAAADSAPGSVPLQPPPGPAGASLQALQQALLLYAMAAPQTPRGVSLHAAAAWVEQQWLGLSPPLAFPERGIKGIKPESARRALRNLLLKGMEQCEEAGWGTVSRCGAKMPRKKAQALLLFCPGPQAPDWSSAELAAELPAQLRLVAEALNTAAPVDVQQAQAEQAAAQTQPVQAAVAAPRAQAPVPAAAAEGRQAQEAVPAAVQQAGAGDAGAAAAEPLLLAVFEDRAPPPLSGSAPAVAAAAAGAGGNGDGGAGTSEADADLEAAESQAALAAADAKESYKLRMKQLRREVAELKLPKAEGERQLLLLEGVELTGQTMEELAAMKTPKLKNMVKKARQAITKAKKANSQSAAVLAAEVLDCLFDAAASKDQAVWEAACAALTDKQRAALAARGVDLELYRSQILVRGAATRAAAGIPASCLPAADADADGDAEISGDGSAAPVAVTVLREVVAGVSTQQAAAVAAAPPGTAAGPTPAVATAHVEGSPAGLQAAVAAHGGHYLRSCDEGAASGGSADPQQHAAQHAQQEAKQEGQQGVLSEQERQAQQAKQQWEQQEAQRKAQWQARVQQEAELLASLTGQPPSQHQQGHVPAEQAQQAQQQQAAPAAPSTSRPQPSLSPLHYEVAALAARATPTPTEVAAVQHAVLAVSEVANSLWGPQARTALFGSQATGLALPGSDLDIVILGVGAQLARAASGFSPVQRRQLGELLEDLMDAMLKRHMLVGRAQIIEARVPIIKCKLNVGGGLAADISLGVENGAHAVDFVRRQVLAVPPLRPLCLAVKAFLRERGANEVFTGGISSYSVFNMVMAHLQLEGYDPDTSPVVPAAPPPPQQQYGRGEQQHKDGRGPPQRFVPPQPADLSETLTFLHQMAVGALPAMTMAAGVAMAARSSLAQQQQQQQQHAGNGKGKGKGKGKQGSEAGGGNGGEAQPAGSAAAASAGPQGGGPKGKQGRRRGPDDLGTLLWSFFDRFGNRFSYAKEAVSVRMGGVCLKVRAWRNAKRPWALAVEDPQEMGKDIGSGSSSIREIKESFAAAAEQLAEVCEDLDANEAVAAAAAPAPVTEQQQQEGQQQAPGASTAQSGGVQGPLPRRPGQGPLLAGVLDVEAAVGRDAAASRTRSAMEAKAAAKSQQVLHQRIRGGIAVGKPVGIAAAKQPSLKQRNRLARMESKAARRQRLQEENEAYLASGKKGKRKLGSKQTQAVEAAWGSSHGQFKEFGDGEERVTQKQKRANRKQKKAQAVGANKDGGDGGSGKKPKRKNKQGDGSAKKKKARQA